MAHFMLRSIDSWIIDASIPIAISRSAERSIITSGPQMNAAVRVGTMASPSSRLVTSPTGPGQSGVGLSTLTETNDPGDISPDLDFCPETHVVGATGTDEYAKAAVPCPVSDHMFDHRLERSETDAAGHDQHVVLQRAFEIPRAAKWASHADRVADAKAAQPTRRIAVGTDSVLNVLILADAAHGDRDFASAERREHQELAWADTRPGFGRRPQVRS